MEKLWWEEDCYNLNEDEQVSFKAKAEHYFSKGCMYLSNGDPGYPDEEYFEITDLKVYEYLVWDEGKDSYVPKKVTPDIVSRVEDLCYSNSENFYGQEFDPYGED